MKPTVSKVQSPGAARITEKYTRVERRAIAAQEFLQQWAGAPWQTKAALAQTLSRRNAAFVAMVVHTSRMRAPNAGGPGVEIAEWLARETWNEGVTAESLFGVAGGCSPSDEPPTGLHPTLETHRIDLTTTMKKVRHR